MERLRFGEIELLVESPAEADALVRRAEAEGDAERGYWAHVWPSARMLAEFIARTALVGVGTRILEIGCGVGLVGLVAAKRGGIVTLTDYSGDAIAMAERNAALNGVTITAARFDWNDAPDAAWRPDVLLGADVLYFAESHGPIAALVRRLGCLAILGYPNRPGTAGAIGVFERAGLRVWDAAAGSGRILLAQP